MKRKRKSQRNTIKANKKKKIDAEHREKKVVGDSHHPQPAAPQQPPAQINHPIL
jgi:hypothetical protein